MEFSTHQLLITIISSMALYLYLITTFWVPTSFLPTSHKWQLSVEQDCGNLNKKTAGISIRSATLCLKSPMVFRVNNNWSGSWYLDIFPLPWVHAITSVYHHWFVKKRQWVDVLWNWISINMDIRTVLVMGLLYIIDILGKCRQNCNDKFTYGRLVTMTIVCSIKALFFQQRINTTGNWCRSVMYNFRLSQDIYYPWEIYTYTYSQSMYMYSINRVLLSNVTVIPGFDHFCIIIADKISSYNPTLCEVIVFGPLRHMIWIHIQWL